MKTVLNARERLVVRAYRRFEAALPRLMRRHRGRWVVFLDGEVKSAHDNEESALAAGIERFGADAAFIVAPVRKVVASTVGPSVRPLSL